MCSIGSNGSLQREQVERSSVKRFCCSTGMERLVVILAMVDPRHLNQNLEIIDQALNYICLLSNHQDKFCVMRFCANYTTFLATNNKYELF